MIADNLSVVQELIDRALHNSGRNPGSVRLVVVSKQIGIAQIEEARTAGAVIFGENKIQEAVSKVDQIETEGILWHFIGHLQKNKVKFLEERFGLIHSVDSLDLAEKISKQCQEEKRTQRVLLQVNISGEPQKFGMEPGELENNLVNFSRLKGIRVDGLMTMPPFHPNPENSRKYFSHLRELRDRFEQQNRLSLPELSMGMTNDFEVAVEEGATLVRVGTAIFGPRPNAGSN